MLDVVSCIGEERIGNRLRMAVKTGGLGVYKVARIMINVMGEQVQRTGAIIYSTMTTGTVTTTGAAGSCGNQAVVVASRIRMTGGTGVMDSVIIRINREPGSYRCVMTAGAVSSKGYTTGGNVIDAMRTGIRRMTGLAVCAAAGTRCRVGNQRQILIACMTGGAGIMLQVVSRIGKGRVRNCGAMAILTRGGQVHTVGRVMVYVMGKQIKGRTVIDSAVALRTVASNPAVL